MALLLLIVIYIFLPGMATLFAIYMVARRYLDAYRELCMDAAKDELLRAEHYQKALLLTSLLTPSFIYCILLLILILQTGDLEPYQEEFVLYVGSLMCASSVLSVTGIGYIYTRAIPQFIKDPRIRLKSGRPYNFLQSKGNYSDKTRRLIRKQTYTKHLVIGLGPHSLSIFTLLICIFILTFSNTIGSGSTDEAEIEDDQDTDGPLINSTRTDDMRIITLITGISLFPSLFLSAYLPSRVKGSLEDKDVFYKRLGCMAVSQVPLVLSVIVSMVIIF